MFDRLSVSKVARLLLPPIIYRVGQRLGRPHWEYVGDHWPQNDPRSAGWDDSSVVRNMRENWAAYKRALDGTAPLAFWPWFTGEPVYDAHNVLMTYGYVLGRAVWGKTRISVLDWGGAVGNYAAVAKALFPKVEFEFTVKERSSLCAAGRELLPTVSFTSSDEECFCRRY